MLFLYRVSVYFPQNQFLGSGLKLSKCETIRTNVVRLYRSSCLEGKMLSPSYDDEL